VCRPHNELLMRIRADLIDHVLDSRYYRVRGFGLLVNNEFSSCRKRCEMRLKFVKPVLVEFFRRLNELWLGGHEGLRAHEDS